MIRQSPAVVAGLEVEKFWVLCLNRKNRLLKRIEQRARARGLTRIFVLTTRTEHWFLKRGFVKVTVDDLPEDRRRLYNWQRKSLVLMKQL